MTFQPYKKRPGSPHYRPGWSGRPIGSLAPPHELVPSDPEIEATERALESSEQSAAKALWDLEAEMSVLASAMLYPESIPLLAATVQPRHFYHPAHALIWQVQTELATRGEVVDIVSVSRGLSDRGRLNAIGGMQYLGEITEFFVSSPSSESHAKLVVEMHQRRALLSMATELRRATLAGDMAEVERVLGRAAEIRAGDSKAADEGTLFDELVAAIETGVEAMEAYASGSPVASRGLATGIKPLDDGMPGGFLDGDTVIVAGGTSAGKSVLVSQFGESFAEQRQDQIVIVFSLEMKRRTHAERELAKLASRIEFVDDFGVPKRTTIPTHAFRTGAFTADQGKAFEGVMGLDLSSLYSRIHVIDDFDLGIDGLRTRIARIKARTRRKVAAIIIDYLQLLAPDDDSPHGEAAVSAVSRACKKLASKESCVLVLVSQFSRKYDTKDRPRLSHLKYGSAIEQDASTVILLHRPDLASSKTTAYVDKARHTGTFEAELIFRGESQDFTWPATNKDHRK